MADDIAEILDFPMLRPKDRPFALAPEYEDLRARCPVAPVKQWDGGTAWLVSRYEDQRAILADPRASSDNRRTGFPFPSKAAASRAGIRTLVTMDDPEHAEHRNMLTKHFTVQRANELRPLIRQVVDEVIDEMTSTLPPIDLVDAFAKPVPTRIMCAFLGVPYSERRFVQERSPILGSPTATPEQSRTAALELGEFFGKLIDAKMSDPADDVLSELVTKHVKTGKLTREGAINMAALIMNAGHDTMQNMIALGVLTLLEHPGELARLRESDDPELAAGAVDELLRYLNVAQNGRRRVALEDIEVAGQVIRAGEGIIMPTESGNRDERFFADPEVLDVGRAPRHQIAFAYGIHQCLGQALARVELEIAYTTLLRRIPSLRLATPLAQIEFNRDTVIYGVRELPVSWLDVNPTCGGA